MNANVVCSRFVIGTRTPMRRRYPGDVRRIAIMCGLAACTAANPAFDTGDVGATTGSSSTGTIDVTTTSTADAGSTADTSTSRATSESTTGSTDDGGTMPPEPRMCCSNNECDVEVRDCVCGINGACCTEEWSTACEELAIACNGVCEGNLRPCCVAHGQPACTGILLDTFCITHGTCCSTAWTAECVAAYDAEFGVCDLGACDQLNARPGCDDPAVMECVCVGANKPQCCIEAWTDECVIAAAGCG